MTAGTRYAFEADSPCPDAPAVEVTVRTGPVAQLPATIDRLRARPHVGSIRLPVNTSECTRPVRTAYADLDVDLPADAAEFAWMYSLMIDGQAVAPYATEEPLVFGGSALGRGRDRVYALCSGQSKHGLATRRELMFEPAEAPASNCLSRPST